MGNSQILKFLYWFCWENSINLKKKKPENVHFTQETDVSLILVLNTIKVSFVRNQKTNLHSFFLGGKTTCKSILKLKTRTFKSDFV